MLRLAPTQLALGSRDLSWHTERFNGRRARRENQLAKGSVARSRSLVRDPPESAEKPKSIMPCSFPPSLPGKAPVDPDDSSPALVSWERVPRGNRVLWDKFIADDGAATGIEVQNVERRPRITETPRNSPQLIRSLKGSIEEDFPGSTGAYRDAFGISHSQNASNETNTSPRLQYHLSSNSYPSFEDDDDKDERLVSSNAPVAFRQFELPIRSSSMSCSSKGSHGAASQDARTIKCDHASGHTDLDGCSDSVLANHDHRMIEVSITPEESEYVATRSIAHTPRIGTGPFPDRVVSSENPRLPELPMHRSFDSFRLRSTSGLPRSPLYISQVAVPSSPEKRPRPYAHSSDENSGSETTAEPSGLLAVPPRRRKKYKVQSQGYIFDESALESAQVYGIDRLSIEDQLQNVFSSNSLSSRAVSIGTRESIFSQMILFGSSLESSNLDTSPFSSPSLSPPRTSIASPRLPSHPFSATPRTTSSRLPLSPASPSASNPAVSSFSPSPTSQRMAVYNDNLPAATQPQTPALLPLNGLPAMSLQNPFGIGIGVAQTAPAGMMMGRRRGESIRPITPTRRGGALIEDQENLGVEVESRRRRVRETASREWQWEWDLEGEEQDESSEAGLDALA
ncbi:hypothetical protein MMC07_003254 [Pseudocyphellaria aurata]|nr:hypothetical protein [Pseudocyphellaria aurata]